MRDRRRECALRSRDLRQHGSGDALRELVGVRSTLLKRRGRCGPHRCANDGAGCGQDVLRQRLAFGKAPSGRQSRRDLGRNPSDVASELALVDEILSGDLELIGKGLADILAVQDRVTGSQDE